MVGFVAALLRCGAGDMVKATQYGGDMVKAKCEEHQRLHSDGGSDACPSHGCHHADCNWICVSIALGPISSANGGLYLVGRQTMNRFANQVPPLSLQPADWDKALADPFGIIELQRGDCLVRDPRIWHAGAANLSECDRFVPAVVFTRQKKTTEIPANACKSLSFPLCSLM